VIQQLLRQRMYPLKGLEEEMRLLTK